MFFKVATFNVRSLFTGFNYLKDIFNKHKFDIVIITETWLSQAIPDNLVCIDGYRVIREDRQGRGGGLAIYHKNNILIRKITIEKNLNSSLEQLWVSFKINNINIGIGGIYRPPNSGVADCINELENSVSQVLPIVDEIILAGDININMLNLVNSNSNQFLSFMEAYGFSIINNEPTRVNNVSSSLIDIIAISNLDLVVSNNTIDAYEISDHSLVYCDMIFDSIKQKQSYRTFRDFKYFDYNMFFRDLISMPWGNLLLLDDVDELVNTFNEYILSVFDVHAPLKTIRISKPKAPWLTDPLKIMIKTKKAALSKYKRTKSNADWQEYKNIRNICTMAERNEKRGYLEFVQNRHNSQKMWETLTLFDIIVKKNNKNEIPEHLCDPNKINDYFVNSVNQMIVPPPYNTINTYNTTCFNPNINLELKNVNEEQIEKIINNIKSNATGNDGISIKMIKICLPFLTPFITLIVNKCITSGKFPVAWKKSLVIPLNKINKPENLSDLRPINILPALSKIVEKAIYEQIYLYVTDNKILPEHQSGFRQNYSTTSALLKVTDDIIGGIDREKVTILLSLDYSKAFDTMNHELLCAKLKYYKFNENSISFIKSFLSNRSQSVTINGITSNSINVIHGAPQGSILAPLLFIIYTSDFHHVLNNFSMHAYADDTNLYYTTNIDHLLNMEVSLNKDIKELITISKNHCLSINPGKSSVIAFGRNKDRQRAIDNISLQVDGHYIQYTDNVKCLGLTIDYNLRFVSHINSIIRKAYGLIKNLYANRHYLNKKLKIMLCNSIILSQFNYCDIVYGPCLDLITSSRIQKVQNSCIRLIFGLRRRDHVSSFTNEIKWLKMHYRRELHIATFTHKLLITQTPIYLVEKLMVRHQAHSRNLRYLNQLTMPQHTSAFYERSFSYYAVTVYNSFPDEIKRLSLNTFKYKTKELLLSKQ